MKAVAALAGSAVAVVLSLKLLTSLIGKKAYDGLDGIISFSSKLIAASRAVESQEEHPLVADPLAEQMAGPAAVANSRARAVAAPPGSERKFKVGKMAVRTRWFDDQIEAALGMPVSVSVPLCLRSGSDPPPAASDKSSYVWSHPDGHKPRQVVMLGAGMDSRPWRMKLPADLHWFELDQADVVAAKQKLLGELAAEVPPQGDGRESDEAQQPGTPGQSGLTRHLSLDKVRHPLRCASWTAVAADLADPSWAGALLAAGFNPSKPTVWVAEGLLMYLEQATVQSLLAAAAGMSPEGSAFVGLSITQPVLDRLRAKKLAAANGGATGGSQGQSLLDTWVFGCPQDPTQFLAGCGWQLQLATDRDTIAAALGIAPELLSLGAADASAPATSSSNGAKTPAGSLFLTAVPIGKVAAAEAQ